MRTLLAMCLGPCVAATQASLECRLRHGSRREIFVSINAIRLSIKWTGSQYVALDVLGLCDLSSWRITCLGLLGAGIEGVHGHDWLPIHILISSELLFFCSSFTSGSNKARVLHSLTGIKWHCGWRCGSGVVWLPAMLRARGSMPSTIKK